MDLLSGRNGTQHPKAPTGWQPKRFDCHYLASVGRFAGDPDYTLRWPPELFEAELRRLLSRAERFVIGREWREEVEALLRGAFTSSIPSTDFGNILSGFDDEPF